jgi:hypothetical protein
MEFQAHEMGGSPYAANLVGIFAAFVLSPAFAGLKICRAWIPGVALAKPRSTPGFMLAPAPQANSRHLELRRLTADISCSAG